jgi:hypothetical protein
VKFDQWLYSSGPQPPAELVQRLARAACDLTPLGESGGLLVLVQGQRLVALRGSSPRLVLAYYNNRWAVVAALGVNRSRWQVERLLDNVEAGVDAFRRVLRLMALAWRSEPTAGRARPGATP